jgi:hypothetical protein
MTVGNSILHIFGEIYDELMWSFKLINVFGRNGDLSREESDIGVCSFLQVKALLNLGCTVDDYIWLTSNLSSSEPMHSSFL